MATRLVIQPGFEKLLQELGLDHPRSALHFSRGDVVRDSGSSRVFRFSYPDPDGEVYFFKVYRYYRLRPLVTFTYRKSRARTEFESLIHLRQHGLPAVEPVAFGSHRTLRVIHSCFLLTRAVPQSADLDVYLPEFFSLARDPAWRRQRDAALATLANLIRRQHDSGFCSHDLYFRNILIEPKSVAELQPKFWFLDHPKGRVFDPLSPRQLDKARIWDLACLDKHAEAFLSRTQRLRFFLRYLAVPRLTPTDRKLLHSIFTLRTHMLQKRNHKLQQHSGRRSGKPGTRPKWPSPPSSLDCHRGECR